MLSTSFNGIIQNLYDAPLNAMYDMNTVSISILYKAWLITDEQKNINNTQKRI